MNNYTTTELAGLAKQKPLSELAKWRIAFVKANPQKNVEGYAKAWRCTTGAARNFLMKHLKKGMLDTAQISSDPKDAIPGYTPMPACAFEQNAYRVIAAGPEKGKVKVRVSVRTEVYMSKERAAHFYDQSGRPKSDPATIYKRLKNL